VRGKSAVDLARDLLQRFDGQLTALVDASLDELASVSGIGMAKAAQLKASFELARRALSQEMSTRDSFTSPGKVRDWLRLKLANRPTKYSWPCGSTPRTACSRPTNCLPGR
jgi:DNA repair protein RadC